MFLESHLLKLEKENVRDSFIRQNLFLDLAWLVELWTSSMLAGLWFIWKSFMRFHT